MDIHSTCSVCCPHGQRLRLRLTENTVQYVEYFGIFGVEMKRFDREKDSAAIFGIRDLCNYTVVAFQFC